VSSPPRVPLRVLSASRSRRRRRRPRWPIGVAAVVVALVAALIAARIIAAEPGYSNTHGTKIVHYTLASSLLGRHLGEIAVVPPGGGKRPLLVLLHGRHDPGPLSWLIPSHSGPESMLSDSLLSALAGLGARAPVVVLLNGGGHSYFHDRRAGPWGSMLLKEAIPDAVRRFGTVPGKIAIGGISMGGYGALFAAGVAPSRFCAVGGHSPAVWLTDGDGAPGAFDNAEDFARHNLFAEAAAGRFDHLPVWIDVGTNDPFRVADTTLAAKLRQRGVHVTFHVWPGGHTESYWHSHMSAYLSFYAAALAAC
jgi:predicted esterase